MSAEVRRVDLAVPLTQIASTPGFGLPADNTLRPFLPRQDGNLILLPPIRRRVVLQQRSSWTRNTSPTGACAGTPAATPQTARPEGDDCYEHWPCQWLTALNSSSPQSVGAEKMDTTFLPVGRSCRAHNSSVAATVRSRAGLGGLVGSGRSVGCQPRPHGRNYAHCVTWLKAS